MYRAKVEFILNIDSFRNSELFQPGIYMLKFNVFHEDDDRVHYATPKIVQAQNSDEEPMSLNRWTLFHDLKAPETVEESASFVTNIFLIRYADECITMNHRVRFTTEVDLDKFHLDKERHMSIFDPGRPSKLNQAVDNEFFLRVELLHAPKPTNVMIADSAMSADNLKAEISQSYPLSKFKKVQTKLFQVNNVLAGQSSFLHVQFGG